VPSAQVTGSVTYKGHDVYGDGVNATEVRRRIGMVFQKPNPFPKSIFDNVAFGPRLNGKKKGLDDLVEKSLTDAALWDEVKDKLHRSGLDRSDGVRNGGLVEFGRTEQIFTHPSDPRTEGYITGRFG